MQRPFTHVAYVKSAIATAALVTLLSICTRPARAQCIGDCSDDGSVTVDEILTMVNIALGNLDASTCLPGDANHDAGITVDEVLAAVNNALAGCPATPTPGPQCESLAVTVALVYDTQAVPDLAGLVVDLNYPGTAVELPGSGSDDSVIERVTDVSGATGFSSIQDLDTNSDGTDDRLHNVYVATLNIPPGDFEEVLFDCVAGASVPPTSAFSCTVSDTVDSQANPVEGVGCAVTVSPMVLPSPTPGAPTPTASATPTLQPPTPTVTPQTAAVCGNGSVEAGETCDDGNTVTNPPDDTCPADCTIITCTPGGTTQTVAVSFTPPAGKNVAAIAVLLEYPDGTVQIPGTGSDAAVAARVTNPPSSTLVATFDYDYALKVTVAGTRTITVGQLFRATFDLCQGVTPPAAAAFTCTVLDASGTDFQPVSGVTCSATPL
jgi:cysteine-rich repeat protein